MLHVTACNRPLYRWRASGISSKLLISRDISGRRLSSWLKMSGKNLVDIEYIVTNLYGCHGMFQAYYMNLVIILWIWCRKLTASPVVIAKLCLSEAGANLLWYLVSMSTEVPRYQTPGTQARLEKHTTYKGQDPLSSSHLHSNSVNLGSVQCPQSCCLYPSTTSRFTVLFYPFAHRFAFGRPDTSSSYDFGRCIGVPQ